ncbi:MAG TPA: TetR/AcrR family transcriptional regulator [Pseudonocardiaceae bacterium]|jgi:DNA-binding transcriptional regulator YbjK|nr:TetR/AcrR family transcriptional regulator [Pseudonocardiaceae bacterium]
MAGRRDELHERRTGYRSRRPLLADAAITILARDGGRGLTHRAVDREAGVPQGTTKNYYPSRQTILQAAANRMAEQHRAAVDHLRDTTPATVTPHQLRLLYPALIRRAVHGDPTQTLAMFELYLEAVRQPAIRAALAAMATANATAAVELHHAAGIASDTTTTGLLDACILGVMAAQLALPPETLDTIGLHDTDTVGTHLFDATTGYPDHLAPPLAAQA